jgi:hypothetical protein
MSKDGRVSRTEGARNKLSTAPALSNVVLPFEELYLKENAIRKIRSIRM